MPFTLFWLHSPWRGSWDDGAFTCTLWSCTQTSIFLPCPQFKTICEGASGNNLCLLLLSGPFRAEIQDAETGKGEEMLRCPRGSMSSAAWHERGVPISVHVVPHPFPDPAGWRQCLHWQRICLGIACLSLWCPPRDSCSVRAVPHRSTGTVIAALWSWPFLNLSWLKGWLQILLRTQRGSAWLRLLQGFRDQPICLLTRQSC